MHQSSTRFGIPHTSIRLISCAISILLTISAFSAEDAAYFHQRGIQALKESQTNPKAILEAARSFAKAQVLYCKAADEPNAREMNAYLYWCRKKMTLADIDQLAKETPTAAVPAPKADQAREWLNRAEEFAKVHPDEHLLIAVRFFEVADRFQGAPESLAAQSRSLQEQTLASKVADVPKTVAVGPEEAKKRIADAPTAVVIPAVPAKRAVPPIAKLKESEVVLKEVLKADYAKTTMTGRAQLSAKLLNQARDANNDDASLYVLLREAMFAAAQGNQTELAADALVRRFDSFTFDLEKVMEELQSLNTGRSPEMAEALSALYSYAAAEALARENPDLALRFATVAEILASGHGKLYGLIRDELTRIAEV